VILSSRKVIVGIRPEGFVVDEENKSPFKFEIDLVETIGRDTTLIIDLPSETDNILDTKSFKAIVDAMLRIKAKDLVHFMVRPEKMFIFNLEGERLE